jgi:putative heme-binding domain-containing protein
MPRFWMLPKKDQRVIAGYVRTLGAAGEATIAGNPARGAELFSRHACVECHTVGGRGGVRGPDLTDVGSRRGVERLRQALLEPAAERSTDAEGYAEFLPVRIAAPGGRTIEGLRVNEDGFTIQVRDLDNRIHSFRKAEVEISKGFAQSIMPSFASVFSGAELDDVIAYLTGLRASR